MKTVLTKVESKDIRQGECGSAFNCPVARAISRVTPRDADGWGQSVTVGMTSISVGERRGVRTPASVKRFIRRFDGGDTVAPFAFRLPRRMFVTTSAA